MSLFETSLVRPVGTLFRAFLCVLLLCSVVLASSKPLVVFANPGGEGDVFFQPMTDFMQAAADDLGFELEVYYGDRNHVLIDENVQTIFKRKRLPDYLIGMNARGSGKVMLQKAEAAGVQTIFINQSFLGEERAEAGLPREKYTNWMFEFLPDDTHSGYLLAKTLIKEAKSRKFVDGEKLQLLAISGHETSSASILRELGLKQALAEHPEIQFDQLVHAGWKRDRARELTQGLLKRYPDVDIIWSASDLMALGACDGIRGIAQLPGKDILTGGVDWSALALGLVSKGDFTATVGGHFMDGGWALVMLYDHINGKQVPLSSTSEFSVLTADNVTDYQHYFGTQEWDKIDFKKFSQHLNPDLKEYNFGLEAMLGQVRTD